MRYKFTIEYDGSRFPLGWQSQNEKSGSVQEVLTNAAFKMFQTEIEFYGAGRTDKMVHATGQVAHADLPKQLPLRSIQDGMNFYLTLNEARCRIKDVMSVSPDFHARFSAKQKEYEYLIYHGQTCSIFNENRVWRIRDKVHIDWAIVQNEIKSLIGHHDFVGFRAASCQSTNTYRTIDKIDINNINDLISIKFYGKSFLHKQIRIMVGTLIDIGSQKIKTSILNILNAKKRSNAGQTAPGYGLYLRNILY